MNEGTAALPPHAVRAHAIKNCLAVVKAVMILVSRESAETSRERLARALDAVARIQALLEDDLAVVGHVDPLMQSSPSIIDISSLVAEVVRRSADHAAASCVTLDVHCCQGSVLGHFDELVEALTNVVVNAIDAAPASGAVVVESKAGDQGGFVVVVQNDGPEVPEAVIEKLGTPLGVHRVGGSGLGLAVTKCIVDRYGGALRVESPGRGARVSVWLPTAA